MSWRRALYILVSCRHPTLYRTASWPVSIHGWLRWWEEGASCTSLRLWKVSWLLECYIWQERKCSWSSWKPNSAWQQRSWRYVDQAFEFACSTLLQFKRYYVKYTVQCQRRIQLSSWACSSLLCRVQAELLLCPFSPVFLSERWPLNQHKFSVSFCLF